MPGSRHPSTSGLAQGLCLSPQPACIWIVGQLFTCRAACMEGVNLSPIGKNMVSTFTLGASWIRTSDSVSALLIMKGKREALLSWRWLMLMNFIFTPQDFSFLRHSGNLLDNWMMSVQTSSLSPDTRYGQFEVGFKDQLRAGSQVSTHNHVVTGWQHRGEDGAVCLLQGGEC